MEEQLTQRQLQALQTKERLYNAAIELFEANGYENVLIEDITKAAGVAKGTFYLYYKSKKDLMYYTVEIYDNFSIAAYEKSKDIVDLKEKILAYFKYYYEGVFDTGKQVLRAVTGNNVLDGYKERVNSDQRHVRKVLNLMVQEGYDNGMFSKDKDIAYYRRALMMAMLGADYYWCTRQNVNVVDIVLNQATIILDGLTSK